MREDEEYGEEVELTTTSPEIKEEEESIVSAKIFETLQLLDQQLSMC